MSIPVFRGWIERAAFCFNDSLWPKITKYLASLEGKPIEMIIRPVDKKRSPNQNAYYWGVVIKMLVEYSAGKNSDKSDRESVHMAMACKFLKIKKTVCGLPIELVRSTTSLSTKEFELYMENIRSWAAISLNLNIPLPNEIEIPNHYQEC